MFGEWDSVSYWSVNVDTISSNSPSKHVSFHSHWCNFNNLLWRNELFTYTRVYDSTRTSHRRAQKRTNKKSYLARKSSRQLPRTRWSPVTFSSREGRAVEDISPCLDEGGTRFMITEYKYWLTNFTFCYTDNDWILHVTYQERNSMFDHFFKQQEEKIRRVA